MILLPVGYEWIQVLIAYSRPARTVRWSDWSQRMTHMPYNLYAAITHVNFLLERRLNLTWSSHGLYPSGSNMCYVRSSPLLSQRSFPFPVPKRKLVTLAFLFLSKCFGHRSENTSGENIRYLFSNERSKDIGVSRRSAVRKDGFYSYMSVSAQHDTHRFVT